MSIDAGAVRGLPLADSGVGFSDLARRLEVSNEYKVLRRAWPAEVLSPDDGTETRFAIVLDTETTGIDQTSDEVICLAMAKIEYGADTGLIYRVVESFEQYQQPSSPISDEITALTGITNDMVAGKSIDWDEVASFIEDSVLVIAHNAEFDWNMVSKRSAALVAKHWACSCTQIDWKQEGIGSAMLEFIAFKYGFFYEGHRALNDIMALVSVLAQALPRSGGGTFARLLENARQPAYRVEVYDSPIETKDLLKVGREYRWFPGSSTKKKHWHKVVTSAEAAHEEEQYVRDKVCLGRGAVAVFKINGLNRFSSQ